MSWHVIDTTLDMKMPKDPKIEKLHDIELNKAYTKGYRAGLMISLKTFIWEIVIILAVILFKCLTVSIEEEIAPPEPEPFIISGKCLELEEINIEETTRIGKAIESIGKDIANITDNAIINNDRRKDVAKVITAAKSILKGIGYIGIENSETKKEIITTKNIDDWKNLGIIVSDYKSLAKVCAYGKAIEKVDKSALDAFYQSISYIDENGNQIYFKSEKDIYKLFGFNEHQFDNYAKTIIQHYDGDIFEEVIFVNLEKRPHTKARRINRKI